MACNDCDEKRSGSGNGAPITVAGNGVPGPSVSVSGMGGEMEGFFESLSAQTGLDPGLIRGIIIGVILFLVVRGL